MDTLCGLGIHFTVDGFRILYGLIAAFMWLVSGLFSIEYFSHYKKNKGRYWFFLIATFLATEGVFFSADFYTTFIFFEIMSFTSYVWVIQDERAESMRAGATYLAVAVIGGLVMLMGIFLLYTTLGTVTFSELKLAYMNSSSTHVQARLWAAGLCMLFGFGAKAGAFPLHIWLPKAHPVAPAPASALLSGMLTKTGVFGILILTTYIFGGVKEWATMILLLGVITMALGAVLALFSIDLKRTLACSSVSQIGFILVGVGVSGLLLLENALAARGSLLHMVNHSLIKLVLFIAAGVVYMNLHKLDLNAIRGFGRKKPLLMFIFLMGALGIGGVPLFNGYISKTLIHEGIVEYIELVSEEGNSLLSLGSLHAIEWIFLISGGLTVAYMTKLFVAIFVEKNEDATLQEKYDQMAGHYMNPLSTTVLTVSAVILPVLGFLPTLTMDRLADMGQDFMGGHSLEHAVHYFSLENLKGAIISLIVGALVYVVIVRKWMIKKEDGKTIYLNRWPESLDLENLIYRPVLLSILPMIFGVLCRVLDCFVDTCVVLIRKTILSDRKIPHELEEGTPLSEFFASVARMIYIVRQRFTGKKTEEMPDFSHIFAMRHEQEKETVTVIARSLSFGLLLFCVGLVLTVVYLLFAAS